MQSCDDTLSKQEVGRQGEELACRFLVGRGFVVVERNFSIDVGGIKRGEIDVICHDRESLVFVEVRSLTGSYLETPALTVDPAKRGQVVRAARFYLQEREMELKFVRFDVIAVSFGSGEPRIEWYPDAFRPPSTGQAQVFW